MAEERFTAMLLEGHKGAAFEVPFDPVERWSSRAVSVGPRRRGHLVTGTINGTPFESAVVSRQKRFYVLIDDALRQRAGIAVGDNAKIVLRPSAAGA